MEKQADVGRVLQRFTILIGEVWDRCELGIVRNQLFRIVSGR
jgi:hypothetical protein